MAKTCSLHACHLLLAILILGVSPLRAECIGVVTAGGGNEFWSNVSRGARDAGTKHGVNVIVRGPRIENDYDNQSKIISDMVNKGCQALVIAPNSVDRNKQVAQLKAKGIPTVYVDRDPGGERIAAVLTDNYNAGQIAAKILLKHLDKTSRIALFRLAPDIQSTSQREQGFIDALGSAKQNLVIDEYLGNQFTNATIKAYSLLKQQALFNALFTPNESTTLAALRMRKRAKRETDLVHVGFDLTPEIEQALQDEELVATILQAPYDMGMKATEVAVNALRNKPYEAITYTPVQVKEATHIAN